MKCIAVLVYELTIEYNTKVLDGIVDFFEKRDDVKLIISPINVPNSSSSEFDYQYWTSLKVLASEQIDAYIVVTNTFLTYICQFIRPLTPTCVTFGIWLFNKFNKRHPFWFSSMTLRRIQIGLVKTLISQKAMA